jgi:hypothetical protein
MPIRNYWLIFLRVLMSETSVTCYLVDLTLAAHNKCTNNFGFERTNWEMSHAILAQCLPHNWDELPCGFQSKHPSNKTYPFTQNQ